MAAQRVRDNDFFNAYRKIDSVKELVELTKMSDNELYRTIGSAARRSMSMQRGHGTTDTMMESGDYQARSPFFFSELKETTTTEPVIYLDLAEDPIEAGRTVFWQICATFDKVMCPMVNESPLRGYKQEAMSLGMRCYEALSKEFPTVDKEILKAFVALRTKNQFNSCSRW